MSIKILCMYRKKNYEDLLVDNKFEFLKFNKKIMKLKINRYRQMP